MTTVIKEDNAVINAWVMEYKATGDEQVFVKIYNAVQGLTEKLGYTMYHKYKGYADKEEFINVAEFAIYEAIPDYDAEKGGSFTAFLKRTVGWKTLDYIVKPSYNKQAQFNKELLSLDEPVPAMGGVFLDVVEGTISQDLVTYNPVDLSGDGVYGQVIDAGADDAGEMLNGILHDLTNMFTATVNAEEKLIAETVIATILSGDPADKKAINNAVKAVLPEVADATARKKKSRVIKKFNDFAVEQGFESFDLSQF